MNHNCPKCGAEISEGAKFCPECGTAQKVRKKTTQKYTSAKKNKTNHSAFSGSNIIFVVAILSLIIVIIYVYPYFVPAKHNHAHKVPMNAGQITPSAQDQNLLKDLEAKQQANPKGLTENVQLGNFLFDTKRFSEAIKYYNIAIEIDPKNPDVIVDAGVCYFNINNLDEAENYFERALKVNDKHPNALYNLGVVAAQKGDMTKMKETWEKLVKVAPESGSAQNARRMLDQFQGRETKN